MAFKWPWSKKETKQKKQRAYAAAMHNRLVMDWIAQSTSADSEIRGSLKKLRDRSRQLERDNDQMRSFFRMMENNVVGQGIPFQSQVKMQRGNKLDDRLNDMIEAKWTRWKRKQFAHTGGTLSFEDIERLAIRSVARDGDFYVRMIRQSFGGSRIPFALELIEADLVDDNHNGTADNGNEIRMGVEIDRWQRPTAYYLLDRHPGDYQLVHGVSRQTKHIRVPAEEMLPLFVSERAGQTRGVPWIAAAMMKIHHLHGYTEAEVVHARASAAVMGFIQTPEGEVIGDDTQGFDRVTDFEPGVYKNLAPGQTVSVPNVQRPGNQYSPFVKAIIQSIATGIGVSYESLSKDYAGATYSSARQALLEDRDNFRVLQGWLIRNFHQIIFENWLDMAVLSGELVLPQYETQPEKYSSVRWMPRGWSWIDPTKEVSAMKEAVKGGFTTLSEVLAQEGKDFEDIMMRRQLEIERCAELGITLDTDHANSQLVLQAEAISANNPKSEPDPEE